MIKQLICNLATNTNNYMLRNFLFYYFIFFVNSISSQEKTYSDSSIESMMLKSKYVEVKKLANRNLSLVKNLPTNKKIYYLNKRGFAEFKSGNFKSAYKTGLEGLQIIQEIKDFGVIFENLQLLAYSSNRLGKLKLSIDYSNKMLKLSILHKDNKKQAIALTSLASIFMQNKLYKDALKYNSMANRLYKIEKDSNSLVVSNYNIGLAYLNLKKRDSCLHYFFKSTMLLKKYPNPEFETIIYGTIADLYLDSKNYKEWKKYQLIANELANKTGNLQFFAMGLSQLGQYELQNKNYKKAYVYLTNANKKILKTPFPALQIRIDSMLYVASKNQNNFKEALFWYEKYTTLQKHIYSRNQMEALNKAYAEIATIKKTKIIFEREQELIKAKNNSLLLIILLVVFFIITAGYYFFRKKLNTYQNRLFLKNNELEKQIELSKTNFIINHDIKTFELFQRILNIIESDKLYLNPELNAKTLQYQLGTNKKYLYEAISKYSGENFRGFINRYRVNEAISNFEKLIAEDTNFTLNEIYIISGFNSATSFFRVFKKQTGLSPNEYIIQLKNEKNPKV